MFCLQRYREYLFVQVCTIIRVVSLNMVVSLTVARFIIFSNRKKENCDTTCSRTGHIVPGHQTPEKALSQ